MKTTEAERINQFLTSLISRELGNRKPFSQNDACRIQD